MVRAQGGDPDAPLPQAPERNLFRAPRAGIVRRIDARAVGIAAWRLGAGRARKEDPISDVAGVVVLADRGADVAEGEPVLELHADDPARFPAALDALSEAVEIGTEAAEERPLVIERIGA